MVEAGGWKSEDRSQRSMNCFLIPILTHPFIMTRMESEALNGET